MLAEELKVGDSWLADVRIPDGRPLPTWFKGIKDGSADTVREVAVSVVNGGLVLHHPAEPITAVDADGDVVDRFRAAGQVVVVWLTHAVTPTRTVGLSCHAFADVRLTAPLSIAVEDGVAEQIRIAARGHTASFDTVASWLADEFILPPLGGSGPSRIVHSGGAGRAAADLAAAFRLHGCRWVADVALRDDRLRIVRMTDTVNREAPRWPRLSSVDVRLVDQTSAAVASEALRAALAGLGSDGETYLELWNGYNEIERESLLEEALQLGWAPYQSCGVLADGRWRFDIAGGTQSEAFLTAASASNGKLELEAAESLPPEFSGGRGRAPRGVHGALRDLNKSDRTLVLTIEDDQAPAPSGYLYRSLTGDRVRLSRRDDARQRIEQGQAEMPGLRLLIEGTPLPHPSAGSGSRRASQRVLDAGVRAAFGTGEPTVTQLAALRMAIETPDVLLVQGPPGTGKTQFITALLACLDRLGDRALSMNRTLVSSFQQTAVDNVSARARHRGLPPTRVSPRREINLSNVREWRDATASRIDAYLAEHRPEVDRRDVAVQVRRMSSAYHVEPTNDADLGTLLGTLRDLTKEILPPPLLGRLDRTRTAVVARSHGSETLLEPERIEAARVVRSLRTDAVSFADDGQMRAAYALRALDDIIVLDDAHRRCLSAAAAADEAGEVLLDDLAQLRGELLDLLQPGASLGRVPTYDPDVDVLLQEVADAMDTAHAESGDGVDDVLRTYRESLRQDLGLVERTLARYNAVLAATVQQAHSTEMSRILDAPLPVFGTVIVDEAARANPLDLMIPMACARDRIILVGDHKQLPHSLEQKVERELRRDRGIGASELGKSLFERWFDLFAEERPAVRTIRLDTQFRMHPALCRFVSSVFYGGPNALSSHSSTKALTHGFSDYAGKVAAWIDVPFSSGSEVREGTSRARRVEAERLVRELASLERQDSRRQLSFGVITFYREQVEVLQDELVVAGLAVKNDEDEFQPVPVMAYTDEPRPRPRLSVGTVDAFQGMEFDVVFLSVTRSSRPARNPGDRKEALRRYGHLLSDSRMCVAMSRQRRLLIAVGDAAMAVRGSMPESPDRAGRSVAEGVVGFLEFCQGVDGAGIRS